MSAWRKKTLWDVDPKLRMDIMRGMILDISPVFRPYPEKPKQTRLPTGESIPTIYYNDIVRICDLYGCDFKFVALPPESPVGGSYTAATPSSRPLIQIEIASIPLYYWFIPTLAHELSHAIQYQLYRDVWTQIPGYSEKLSVQLAFEWEACRLSYYVYKAHFYDPQNPIPHPTFRVYRSRDSHQGLIDNFRNHGYVLEDDLKP